MECWFCEKKKKISSIRSQLELEYSRVSSRQRYIAVYLVPEYRRTRTRADDDKVLPYMRKRIAIKDGFEEAKMKAKKNRDKRY